MADIDARKASGVPLPEQQHRPPSSNAAAKPYVPFHRPRGFDIVVFSAVLFFTSQVALVAADVDPLLTSVWAASLPGEDAWVFGGAVGFRRLISAMALPVLAIHVTEVWWLDRTRLVPHGVRRGSRDWLLWAGSVLFEGVTGFQRFDRLAREKDAAAEEEKKGKH